MKQIISIKTFILNLFILFVLNAATLTPHISSPITESTPTPTSNPLNTENPEQVPLPDGVNPLTGKLVADKSMLDLPPVLVSVSNFPGATRPQMGLSFAAHIYEFWIGVGMTRFLPIFYGDFPKLQPSMIGDCPIRWENFRHHEPWVGNYVWYDENMDGRQNPTERGVPGVCVYLYDAETNELLDSTTTDSNGYYGFPLMEGKKFYLKFIAPMQTTFTSAKQGNDEEDSDVSSADGMTETISFDKTQSHIDAGLIWYEKPMAASPNAKKIEKRLFIDKNKNGQQDEGENGIEGVQVNLYDVKQKQLVAKTRTNQDGVYTFFIDENKTYRIHVLPDVGASFVLNLNLKSLGDNTPNSYQAPIDGLSPAFDLASFANLDWNLQLKEMQVGPLRSGRIVFQTIAQYFQGARLFYASKHESVEIGGAGNVYGEDPQSISSAFLDVERIKEAAFAEAGKSQKPYAVNIFSQQPPENGIDIERINYFVNILNFSQYRYDALSQTYLRYDDHSDGRGNLYPSVDRLTGRHLQFSNILVMFTEHVQIQGLKIDMAIHPNTKNKAILFRDGKAYPVYWSTMNESYEKRTQLLRPPRIVGLDGKLFPLKPGNMWIIVASSRTTFEEQENKTMRIRFFQPSLDGDYIK